MNKKLGGLLLSERQRRMIALAVCITHSAKHDDEVQGQRFGDAMVELNPSCQEMDEVAIALWPEGEDGIRRLADGETNHVRSPEFFIVKPFSHEVQ